MTTSVTKVISISASHILPNHPGKCSQLHGHNYRIEATYRGDIQRSSGMVQDFDTLVRDMQETIGLCDHKHLNDIPVLAGLQPTAETLSMIWLNELRMRRKGYVRVVVWETDTCYATAEAD